MGVSWSLIGVPVVAKDLSALMLTSLAKDKQ